MRVIEQESNIDLEIEYMDGEMYVYHDYDFIVVDKQGAKQIIEVLKEFVEND